MAIPDDPRPRLTGVRYVGEALVWSAVFEFHFHGVRFSIVAASPGNDAGGDALVPPGYRFDESIEGKILTGVTALAWDEFDKEKDGASERLELQLADMAADACFTTMQQLAPTPLPAAQTLQDQLYPQTYTLQVFTEGGRLTCRELGAYAGIPERHPPVSEDKLRAMKLGLETTDIPIVKASQVVLVRRLHRGLVWRVTVNGEDMVCKSTIDVFEDSIGHELETYLKFKSAKIPGLRVPELKGIVQSQKGVIGILLSYVPHKHSLRALLDGVAEGTIAPSEATPSLRQKWAMQIRETLTGFHRLGILWREAKTDNVLIDDNGDAVVVDFGTNTAASHDKYGTMEGEEQGLEKIMAALRIER